MTDFTWTFGPFTVTDTDGMKDIVTAMDYRFSATDGHKTEAITGTVTLGTPDPDHYVAFADITEEIAIGWANAALDVEGYKAALEQRLTPTPPAPIDKRDPPFQSTGRTDWAEMLAEAAPV